MAYTNKKIGARFFHYEVSRIKNDGKVYCLGLCMALVGPGASNLARKYCYAHLILVVQEEWLMKHFMIPRS
jgi:hypothetical protein